jgi:hypothetical protein
VNTQGKLRIVGAAAALLALTAVGVSGAASASTAKRGTVKTIKMKGDKPKDLKFAGPDSIFESQTLEIVNLTKPAKVGPHTFSLVTKDARPTRDEFRKCGNFKPSTVCDDIVMAHEVEFPPAGPPIIGEPDVDNGMDGWDQAFDNAKVQGDTWFTETKDETTSRVVSAEQDKLFYFCVVHPNMKGKIEVKHVSKR